MSNWSSYKNRKYLTEEKLKFYSNFYSQLFDSFKIDTKDQTVIEIGAGHGIFTEVFINFFKKYTAAEPNETLNESLKELIDDKYKDKEVKVLNSNCEDLDVKGELSFVIFTNSFQFTDFTKCKETIDKILKKNGHLLITLPFGPFMFKDDKSVFDKQEKWRESIIKTITFLMNMQGYKVIYFNKMMAGVVLLLEKL